MGFWIELIQTAMVAAFIAAVAYGGIICGKNLRVRKNAKIAQEAKESVVADHAE